MAKTKILLIDDKLRLLELLQEYLIEKGYEVDTAIDGEKGIEAVRLQKPDLLLLDIQMPGMDGIEVCREIRKIHSKLPIIFVSALDSALDKIRGLDIGADDYITKPFNELEVEARIRALMRRTETFRKKEVLKYGNLTVDPVRREVALDGKLVELSPKEFNLLYFLGEHPEEALSRDQLLDNVWGIDQFVTTRTVDLHILNLRKKLELDPSKPKRFLTVRSIGYKFVP